MTTNTQLSIQDIASTIQVIDLSQSRGAIRGEEMFQIGALRHRLATFVKATQEAQETQEEVVPNSPELLTEESPKKKGKS